MCLRRIAGGRAPRALTPPCPERRGPWEGGGARPATAHGPLLCASEDAEPPHCALWGLLPFRFTSPAPKANGCLQGSLGSLHTLKSLEFHVRSVSLMRPLLCTSAATAFVGPPSFLAGLCPRPSPRPPASCAHRYSGTRTLAALPLLAHLTVPSRLRNPSSLWPPGVVTV